ncbi:MAG TPA: hypothetical protein VG096_26220 [Bryobacteraceae bacterium]|nr:hypothetical protein [Bryobacteraceae bacterium]
MRTQEQALRVYYAAMSDGELQGAAANRNSFVPTARRLLAEELRRRNLASEPSAPPLHPAARQGLMSGLRQAFRH